MYKVGITGELGSGKTYISGLFRDLGVQIYNSDTRLKDIQNSDPELRQSIIDFLGEESYNGSVLNRKWVAGVVFNDPTKLSKLQSLVIPYQLRDFYDFCEIHKGEVFILIESAILYETGWDELVDLIIYVQVPERKRIERAQKRDGITPEDYKARMANQVPIFYKAKDSDWIIHNFTDEPKNSKVKQIYDEIIEGDKFAQSGKLK